GMTADSPVPAVKNPGPVVGPVPPAVAPVPAAAPIAAPVKDYSSYTADELRAELARTSGQVEELEHDKQITEKQRDEQQKKNEARIADLEKKLKELQPDAVKPLDGQTPLEAGKEAMANEKYDDAVQFFGQVLEKSDTGKEAEEATYLRGETYFKKQQFNKAIVDFSHFPEKFQKSSFHPKALLRIAESFEMMGRKEDAKAFYSDLLDKFPKTAEGKLAKKRLKSKK
ncbi:MAG: hypothetical protein JWL77_7032, partial [Chthonomonadaceae bacterium]|nr:hypothetical protein [Chthonomonadaceae bacterium]